MQATRADVLAHGLLPRCCWDNREPWRMSPTVASVCQRSAIRSRRHRGRRRRLRRCHHVAGEGSESESLGIALQTAIGVSCSFSGDSDGAHPHPVHTKDAGACAKRKCTIPLRAF